MSTPKSWSTPYLGLSSRLMLLTLIFLMVTEMIIFIPAITNFRNQWLENRLAVAHTAAMAIEASPTGVVPEALVARLLNEVGAIAIARKMADKRQLITLGDHDLANAYPIDMRQPDIRALDVADTFSSMFMPSDRIIQVIGPPHG